MSFNYLVMVGIAPFSWRFGLIRVCFKKRVYAFGPLRLSIHNLEYSDG